VQRSGAKAQRGRSEAEQLGSGDHGLLD